MQIISGTNGVPSHFIVESAGLVSWTWIHTRWIPLLPSFLYYNECSLHCTSHCSALWWS